MVAVGLFLSYRSLMFYTFEILKGVPMPKKRGEPMNRYELELMEPGDMKLIPGPQAWGLPAMISKYKQRFSGSEFELRILSSGVGLWCIRQSKSRLWRVAVKRALVRQPANERKQKRFQRAAKKPPAGEKACVSWFTQPVIDPGDLAFRARMVKTGMGNG